MFDPWARKIPGKGNGNPFQYSCLGNLMDRPCPLACGILVHWPEMEPRLWAVREQRLNHWTAREFPCVVLKKKIQLSIKMIGKQGFQISFYSQTVSCKYKTVISWEVSICLITMFLKEQKRICLFVAFVWTSLTGKGSETCGQGSGAGRSRALPGGRWWWKPPSRWAGRCSGWWWPCPWAWSPQGPRAWQGHDRTSLPRPEKPW